MRDTHCTLCGIRYEEHPRCHACGYTYCDCQMQLDHHLCGEPNPAPPTAVARTGGGRMSAERPCWACDSWGDWEHDWLDCWQCLANYEAWLEEAGE